MENYFDNFNDNINEKINSYEFWDDKVLKEITVYLNTHTNINFDNLYVCISKDIIEVLKLKNYNFDMIYGFKIKPLNDKKETIFIKELKISDY